MSSADIHRNERILLITIGVLFALVVIPLAATLNLDVDEVSTVHTVAGNLDAAWHRAIGFEAQAPLYFLLLDLWAHLGQSPLMLRLPSILCALATLPLVWRLGARYAPAVNPAIVTAAFALNPWTIWSALEIRLYALIVLIAAAYLLAATRTYLDADRATWRDRALVIGLVCVGIYTQYYFVSLPIAFFVAIAIFGHRRAKITIAIDLAIAALAVLPLIPIVLTQVPTYQYRSFLPAYVRGFAIVGAFLDFALPHDWAGNIRRLTLSNVAYFVIAVGTFVAIGRAIDRPRNDRSLLPIGVVTLSVLIFFYLVTAMLDVSVTVPRQSAVLVIPIALVLFSAIASTTSLNRRRLLITYVSIFASFSVATLVVRYRHLAKDGDSQRLAAIVQRFDRNREPILMFDADYELAVEYYYRGSAPLFAIPRHQSDVTWSDESIRLHSTDEVRRAFNRDAPKSDLWLLVKDRCTRSDIVYGCTYLMNYVDRHYRIDAEHRAEGMRALHLKRRAP